MNLGVIQRGKDPDNTFPNRAYDTAGGRYARYLQIGVEKALKIHKSSIKVDEIARKVLDELGRLAGLKEQAVSLTIEGPLSEIEGDGRRINTGIQ